MIKSKGTITNREYDKAQRGYHQRIPIDKAQMGYQKDSKRKVTKKPSPGIEVPIEHK